MLKPADVYVEYVEIPDGTPQAMMSFVVDRINAAHAENRTSLSRRYGEVMDVQFTQDWVTEFKGTKFLCMEWRTVKFATKEEFFGED